MGGPDSNAPSKTSPPFRFRPGKHFHRAVLAFADALGSVCDSVYKGVNSTGRGCRQAYRFVYGACADLTRKASNASSAGKASFPTKTSNASNAPAAGASGFNIKDQMVTPLRSAHASTVVMEEFKGDKITYSNLLYMIESTSTRETMDRNGEGLNANIKANSSLMRGLVTGALHAHNPLMVLSSGLVPNAPDRDTYLALVRDYMEFRNTRYPEFDEVYRRLKDLGTTHVVNDLTRRIEGVRQAYEQQGKTFDADAYIAETPLLEVTLTDPNQNDSPAWNPAPLIDPETGQPKTMLVTARQVSADISLMRQCLADVAEYVEALKL